MLSPRQDTQPPARAAPASRPVLPPSGLCRFAAVRSAVVPVLRHHRASPHACGAQGPGAEGIGCRDCSPLRRTPSWPDWRPPPRRRAGMVGEHRRGRHRPGRPPVGRQRGRGAGALQCLTAARQAHAGVTTRFVQNCPLTRRGPVCSGPGLLQAPSKSSFCIGVVWLTSDALSSKSQHAGANEGRRPLVISRTLALGGNRLHLFCFLTQIAQPFPFNIPRSLRLPFPPAVQSCLRVDNSSGGCSWAILRFTIKYPKAIDNLRTMFTPLMIKPQFRSVRQTDFIIIPRQERFWIYRLLFGWQPQFFPEHVIECHFLGFAEGE